MPRCCSVGSRSAQRQRQYAPRQPRSRRATLGGKPLSKLAAISVRLRSLFRSTHQSRSGGVVESPQLRHLRERLFRCAVQILDDAAGAEQVVNQALRQAEHGGHELTSAEGRNPHDPTAPLPESDWLLRQVVRLALQRLKALSIVPVLPPIPSSAQAGGEAETVSRTTGSHGESAAAETTGSSENQRRDRTARALLKLPVEMRVTLILVLMQGRSIPEVASLLGSSETTCAFWLSHGRKQLRRALQRDLAPGTESGGLLRVLVSPETPYDLRGNKKAIARA